MLRKSEKKKRVRSVYASILFRILTVTYLIFFIAYELSSPTNAYFTDSMTYHDTLSVKNSFGEDHLDLEDKQTNEQDSSNTNRKKDSKQKSVDNVEGESSNKGDNHKANGDDVQQQTEQKNNTVEESNKSSGTDETLKNGETNNAKEKQPEPTDTSNKSNNKS